MLAANTRRLLSFGIWILFSIGSLSWWEKLSVLTPEDYPIWWPPTSASFNGSWMFFALIFTSLSLLYVLELTDNRPAKLKQILFWVFILGLGAILVFPFGSKDIFTYVSFTRLHAFYGLNPHLATASDIYNYLYDPFLKNTYHNTVVSPYGPLWTWLSYGLYHIAAGFGLIPFILSFKALGLLMHLLITMMVYKVAEIIAQGSGARAALIYGMNPLALFELVANAHNDGPAILLLLLSIFFVIQKRPLKGFTALGAAVSFKFTIMLTVPIFIWRAVRERGQFLAVQGAVIFALITAFSYLFFKVSFLDVIQTSTGGILNISFASLAYALAGENIVPFARAAGLSIFLLWYYVLLRKINKENLETLNITIGLCFLAYFLFGAYMVHRWYYLWPLAVTVTSPNHPWAKAVVIQTIIILPCYTLMLAFGEVNIDKSITYILSLLPVLTIGLLQYRRSLKNRGFLTSHL